jgi:hypothetical protein
VAMPFALLTQLFSSSHIAAAAATPQLFPPLSVDVGGGIPGGGCHNVTGTSTAHVTCTDLGAALAVATGPAGLGRAVTLSFGKVQRGPFAVRAPDPGKGTLTLRGLDGAAIDGAGHHALLSISGGALNISSVRFINGWVNATHAKNAAPVHVTAKSAHFRLCSFEGNRGMDGGAVLMDGGAHVFQQCHFRDNRGYGGGDGGAHDTGGGGAIFIVYTRLKLLDCLFEDNVATDPPGTPHTKGKPGKPPHGRPGLGHTGTHHGGAVMSVQGHILARNTTFARGNVRGGPFQNSHAADILTGIMPAGRLLCVVSSAHDTEGGMSHRPTKGVRCILGCGV